MLNFENFSQKIKSKQSKKNFLTLKIKLTVLLLTIFTFFTKIDIILGKNSGKGEQKSV